jgi:hypothetical protein
MCLRVGLGMVAVGLVGLLILLATARPDQPLPSAGFLVAVLFAGIVWLAATWFWKSFKSQQGPRR